MFSFSLHHVVLLHAVAAAMSSGMMFVFSNAVLPALSRLQPSEAVRAMQAINVDIVNPLFLALFMGTGLSAAVVAGWHGWSVGLSDNPWLAVAALLYVAGVVFVTIGGNVPLNDALAVLDPERVPPGAWGDYVRPWVRWNNLRTLASAGASAAFILALWRMGS